MGMGLRLGNDRATDRNEISPVVVLWWACGVLAVAVVTLIGVVVGLDGRVGKLEARVGVLERGSVEQVELVERLKDVVELQSEQIGSIIDGCADDDGCVLGG